MPTLLEPQSKKLPGSCRIAASKGDRRLRLTVIASSIGSNKRKRKAAVQAQLARRPLIRLLAIRPLERKALLRQASKKARISCLRDISENAKRPRRGSACKK